jgi:pimeloyl-ACP methyl ester carboxylesterase
MPFAVRKGVRIHYEVEGTGPAVVLHLGGGSLVAWRLAGYVRDLRPDYRLILLDRRGQGESDKPHGLAAHRIEEFRDDVLAVMDAAQAPRAAFWGYSDGAKVGYELADAYPGRVVGLIDHDGMEPDLGSPPRREGRIAFAARLRTLGVATLLPKLAAREQVTESAPGFKPLAEADSDMLALGVEAWTEWMGPWSVVPRLRVPLLMILNGQRQQEDPEEWARLIRLAGRSSAVVPEVGHLGIFLDADRVLPIVRRFLRALPNSGNETEDGTASGSRPSRW